MQAAFELAVLTEYSYELVPVGYWNVHPSLWSFPRLAAIPAAIMALVCSLASPAWRILFTANLVLVLINAGFPLSAYRPTDEEAFLIAPPNFAFGVIAVAAAWMTIAGIPYADAPRRRWRHWTGILIYSLPCLTQIAGCCLGLVGLPWNVVTIRE